MILTRELAITAEALLAIPPARPELLFSGDEDADVRLYRRLAKQFHPDRGAGNGEAFTRLGALKAERDRQMDTGTWCGAGTRELVLESGKRLRLRYLRCHPFELGTLLIGARTVTWLLRGEHEALYKRAIRTLTSLRYADTAMREEMTRYLPRMELARRTRDGFALVITRAPGLVRLRDVLDAFGGAMDPRHVTWILSALHNLGAYLQWAGLTHNAIDLDSCFISPRDHSGHLLGGWWYARPAGERMTHLPAGSAALWRTVASPAEAARGTATPRLDRELIRLMGRTLLGDPGGTRLLRDGRIPPSLRRWVTTPGVEDGIEDYAHWTRARQAAFGVRAFTPMHLAPQAMYGDPR